jgi:hypothetical protein
MRHSGKVPSEYRLAARLGPRDEWGPYVGFWVTTYEMQVDFFETDFLPTLLDLGAWDDRSWTTRIALEKELGAMVGAVVMVDARAYPGRPRSLRIVTSPARDPSGGKLHAKVALLVHENAVRVLVGSANLTAFGYRQNIEVATALTASRKSVADARMIREALQGVERHLGPWLTEDARNLTARAGQFLDELPVQGEEPSEWFDWSGPGVPLWQQFLARWPAGEPVRSLTVVSPFWSNEDGSGPLARFIAHLRDRSPGRDRLQVHLIAAPSPAPSGGMLPVLPESYASYRFSERGVDCFVQPADPQVPKEELPLENMQVFRPLHAKVVFLEGVETTLAYIGSANFTHRGWGFEDEAARANVEAGIVLRRARSRTAELRRLLLPRTTGNPIPLTGDGSQTFARPQAVAPSPPWPVFLRDIRLVPGTRKPEKLDLLARVHVDRVQGDWQVSLEPSSGEIMPVPLLVGRFGDGARPEVRGTLSEAVLNQLLRDQHVRVTWWAHADGVLFPVNVALEARTDLPISPGSGVPNEHMLIAYYQGRIRYEDLFPPPEGEGEVEGGGQDALPSEVDTSGIQSYQMREFVESLEGIVRDLRDASSSERTMRLALLGPVSPVALARQVSNAVSKEERTPTAGGFQLVEILRCLDEVRRFERWEEWSTHWRKAVKEVEAALGAMRNVHASELGPGTHFARYFLKVRRMES